MRKKYVIEGLADGQACPLCIEAAEGRGKENRVVFQVSCEGGYTGPCCSGHLAALIKAAEPAGPPAAPPRPTEVRPAPQAQLAAALPANGPAEVGKK